MASTVVIGGLLLTACGSGDEGGTTESKAEVAAQAEESAPATSVTVSEGVNFGDPSEGLAPRNGQTCQNTRFGLLSVQTSGPVKIWEGKGCTGKVTTISSNVDDVRKLGLTGVRSVRFLTGGGQQTSAPQQPQMGNGNPQGAPATSVTVSEGVNFGDPSEGLAPRNGQTCQNTRFGLLSVQTSGPVKIWEGKGCTGKVTTISSNVDDVRKLGLTGVRSVRFLTGGGQQTSAPQQPQMGNGNPQGAPATSVTVSEGVNFGDPSEGLAPRNGQTCQNTRFGLLSVQTSGPVKIWEGKGCTGKVTTISSNVDDVRKLGLTGVRSVRFL
ncbi:hypothetical protein OG215_39145 (plasmid) [Streptomyces globisporus]|uniref:hypothetical protein n=1 Tax=Streptomyces globisporus TaxID=1908 RepID=UPI0038702C48|nr:hypothetical protein OG215_39145 [Streptomyces globisporus]